MAQIKIQKGATLGGLAKQYRTDVNALLKLNPSITNPNLIRAGASLNVPDTSLTSEDNVNLINKVGTEKGIDTFNLDGLGTEKLESILSTLEKQINQPQQTINVIDLLKQARETAGLPQAEQSLLDIQRLVGQRQTGFEQASDVIQQQLAPIGFIQGQQVALERQRQTNIGNLLRQQELAQTGVGFAQQRATQEFEARLKQAEIERGKPKELLELAKNIFGIRKEERKLTLDELAATRDAARLRIEQAESRPKLSKLEAEINKLNAETAKVIAGQYGAAGELSTKEQSIFLNITNKFQADSVLQQAQNGKVISGIADQVIANPGSAPNQLKSLYILVKNLDPTSAVREGELALANSTQSYLQQWGNTLARINEGRVISPKAAKELAQATKEIVTLWNQAANRRMTQYQSQANTLSPSVGDAFETYLGGFESNFNEETGGGLSDEAAYQEYLKATNAPNL